MSQSLWVDVYDSDNNRLGAGPGWAVRGIGVTRILDGTGSFVLNLSSTDPTLADLLINERRVKLYAQVNDTSIREVGTGIITSKQIHESSGSYQLSVSGPDLLDELKRVQVVYGTYYNDTNVRFIVQDLVSKVSGWSVDIGNEVKLSYGARRFDGVSVLKALQDLAKENGFHFSLTSFRQLRFGALGQQVDKLRIVNRHVQTPEVESNPHIAIVESISKQLDSEATVNRIYPLGGGDDIDVALTLEKATANSPHVVNSIEVESTGALVYYIEDSDSIALNGLKEKSMIYDKIVPLEAGEAAEIAAANQLYNAASSDLLRLKEQQAKYTIQVRKLQREVFPGDKVYVSYHGVVTVPSGFYVTEAIEGAFWVHTTSEQYTDGGETVIMQVSNVDRDYLSLAQTIADSVSKQDKIRPPTPS